MKTLSTIIAAILMASTASAQVRRTFDVDKFDHININAPTEITITQGKKHEIKAEYNLPKGMELIVDTHMNILSIRMNNKQYQTNEHHYIKLHITMSKLRVLDSKGAIDLCLNKMKTDNLILKSNGAAVMDIVDLECENLQINQNGAADFEGKIRCKNTVDINTNGAGDYELDVQADAFVLNSNGAAEVDASFTGRSCKLHSNGSSEIELTAECESLSCESHGASTITAKGTADQTKIKSRGASKINSSMLNQF